MSHTVKLLDQILEFGLRNEAEWEVGFDNKGNEPLSIGYVEL